ncbi:hypothetical protein [Streptomyces sp. N2A]|uniref:hypothetical protein n=1 Tax=Streptomyces sp. N2A TaxID=3073936 RepID=UPI0028708E88|nr:hypothetical protein [Streptomyces sp. N2A]
MRALRIDRFGTPAVLDAVDVPEPEPSPGEVLIRTVATIINPVDDKTREGAGNPRPASVARDRKPLARGAIAGAA